MCDECGHPPDWFLLTPGYWLVGRRADGGHKPAYRWWRGAWRLHSNGRRSEGAGWAWYDFGIAL